MNWDRLRTQLEQILQAAFRIERLAVSQWQVLGGSGNAWQGSIEAEGTLYFPIVQEGSFVSVLAADAALITDSERRLVELTLEAYRFSEKKPTKKSDNELMLSGIRDWIEERIAAGATEDQEPTGGIAGFPALYISKIPFLLYGEYAKTKNSNDYLEPKKLLETFFDGEIMLVPLQDKEWLILANESLLHDSEEDESEESTEERLASLCSSVQSVILNEGAGECHVTVYYPIIPASSLPQTVVKLREAITTGRIQRVGQYIHLPWELYLDQLLNPLSHADRIRFIEQVFKRKDPLLDAEMIQTLETFFELDCNVSETAKKLYIHRNTLLYRLDKFKQESGLDVRTFNEAVHVKIALQLYKVTKRP